MFGGGSVATSLRDWGGNMRTAHRILCAAIGCLVLAACGGGSSAPSAPPPAPDFSITVSPSSVSTLVGATTAPITVSLVPQNGFTAR
jgi:multidrug efflux pump subunit AcrA (membrane-fusion protein)